MHWLYYRLGLVRIAYLLSWLCTCIYSDSNCSTDWCVQKNIVLESIRGREVTCSTLDRQGSKFKCCVKGQCEGAFTFFY